MALFLSKEGDGRMSTDAFSRNLRRLIHRNQWTTFELAVRSGVHGNTIDSYLAGRNLPNLRNLRKIRAGLGCTWDELLEERQHGD